MISTGGLTESQVLPPDNAVSSLAAMLGQQQTPLTDLHTAVTSASLVCPRGLHFCCGEKGACAIKLEKVTVVPGLPSSHLLSIHIHGQACVAGN